MKEHPGLHLQVGMFFFLCLLAELMPAFAAGDSYLTYLAGKAQTSFAFGTAEVTIFPGILQTNKKLAEVRFEIISEVQEFQVFFRALDSILRKHAENCPDIRRQAHVIENGDTCDAGQQGKNDAYNKKRKTKLVGPVPSHHECA